MITAALCQLTWLSLLSHRAYLLECPIKEIRTTFAHILEVLMSSFLQQGGVPISNKPFNEIIASLLSLLAKDVPDNCKQCSEYFSVLSAYAQMGTKACSHMFYHKAFRHLVEFLLGPSGSSPPYNQDTSIRRWSSLQQRDFGPLHATLACLILNCDLVPFRTEGKALSHVYCTS